MERLITHLVLAAVCLLILGVVPRHWWTAEGREVGLLSERVSGGKGEKDETSRHGKRVEGWWPKAGLVTFASGIVAIAALAGGWLLLRLGFPVPLLGHLGMLASALVGIAGLAFFFGKPALFVGTKMNMGLFIILLGVPFGVLAGMAIGRTS